LIMNINRKFYEDRNVRIRHIYYKANKVADTLRGVM
jgi:hypothetical protein